MESLSVSSPLAALRFLLTLLLFGGVLPAAPAYGQTPAFSGVARGSWLSPTGGVTLVSRISNGATSTFSHGNTILDLGGGLFLDAGVANVLSYTQTAFSNVVPGASFLLGNLQMVNGTTFYDSEASGVTLRVSLAFGGATPEATMDLPLSFESTDNSSDRLASADIVTMTSPSKVITGPGGKVYRLDYRWVSMDSGTAVVANDYGYPQVHVYEGSTATIQLWARLVLMSAPKFSVQPADAGVAFGSVVRLTSAVSYAASYQWYRGQTGDTSQPVPGGTIESLTFVGTGTGSYWVRASNVYGSADSRAALVTVEQVTLRALESTLGATSQTLEVIGAVNPGAVYRWYRGGVLLPDVSDRVLYLLEMKPEDAGLYSVTVTAAGVTLTTNAVPIAYVSSNSATVRYPLGANASLTLLAVGSGLTFQWLGPNGQPLQENAHFQGTRTLSLTINKATDADLGIYTCRVGDGTDATALYSIGLQLYGKPVMRLFSNSAWRVGQNVNAFVGTQIEGGDLVISASGFPPGVTFDRYSGALSGKPVRPGTYVLKLQGRGVYGPGPVTTETVVVQALGGNRLGTFQGVVAHDDELNGGLGGRLVVVTTSSATFTGTVTSGAASRSFTGKLLQQEIPEQPHDTLVTGDVPLPATRGVPARTLSFVIGADGVLTGFLRSTTASASLRAIRSPWVGSIRAAHYAGVHIAALPLDPALEGDDTYPQGTGYIVGTVSWAGVFTAGARFADNTMATVSVYVGQDRSIPLHYLLYGGTGSVQGWAVSDGQVMNGNLTWIKHPQPVKSTTRSYKVGFPAHQLSIEGGRRRTYTGSEIILGLPDQDGNAQYTLGLLGQGGDITQSFRVTSTDQVQMPPGAPVSLQIIRDQSRFIGTVSYQGRSGPCFGFFIDRLGMGAGHVQLPESTEPGAPLRSRNITLSPALR